MSVNPPKHLLGDVQAALGLLDENDGLDAYRDASSPGVLDAACTPDTVDHRRRADALGVLDVRVLAAGAEADRVV